MLLRKLLAAVAVAAPLVVAPTEPPVQLTIDGADTGRVFEGIGGLFGGGLARLLYDYPEPQRSQVLDYLFTPGVGAALTHVKLDMGSDANQGAGSEASTRHEPDDENYHRSVQLWLAKQAKDRNPRITLSALQAAPGWVGDYFSQANIDYIVRWLNGVKRHWGLTIDYFAGVVNEPSVIHQVVDWNWVKRLDQAINSDGLRTKLVIGDDPVRTCCPTNLPWLAAEAMRADPALRSAVDVIGSHYAGGTTPDYVKEFGIPIWSSEDGPWTDGWNEFRGGAYNALGSTYNLNYIDGRMTATHIWAGISAYYDNEILPNSGLIRAAEPWSGHYEVMSPTWITAHTNQFVQPGWRYLDGAAKRLPKGGSVVALRSPDNGDYSVVFETQRTQDGKVPSVAQTVDVNVGNGLTAGGTVHVWKSTKSSWFVQQPDIPVRNGSYRITLDPDAIYSVTTTTGQRKGAFMPPAATPFPRSYQDSFDTGSGQPKYMAQQGGSFELTQCVGRPGRCVEQAVRHQPIEWLRAYPTTFLGDSAGWTDATVQAKIRHLQPGYAEVWGRIGNAGADNPDLDIPILPDGYYFNVEQNGNWEIGRTVHGERHRLTAGRTDLRPSTWHTLKLAMSGSSLAASIDDRQVGSATDSTYTHGRAGIGTGWNRVQFDDFSIEPPH